MTAPLDPDFVAAEPPLPLFDLPPVEPAEPVEELSYDRRLTIRRKEMLANGIHPTTKQSLAIGEHPGSGHTCGDCAHHFVHSRAGTYHKCEKAVAGLAHGPLSDVRVGWPACTAWKAESQ